MKLNNYLSNSFVQQTMDQIKYFKRVLIIIISVIGFQSFVVLDEENTRSSASASFSSELFSIDKIDILKERAILESLLQKMTLEEEEIANIEDEALMAGFELYDDNWNNDRVHAYGNISMPDSLIIDCSRYALPTLGHVTSRYGLRRRRMHNGIDLKVYKGDTIVSAFDGKVRVAKYMRGYGNVIVVRHTNGLETVYGHLSKINVAVDQDVTAGQCIGLGGNTGRSTGSHLHFETRLLGRPIDPADIFDFDNNLLINERYVFYSKKPIYRDPAYANIAYHRVRSGETLGKISSRYGISISELCRINKLRSTSILRIGQVIRLENETLVAQQKNNNTNSTNTKTAAINTNNAKENEAKLASASRATETQSSRTSSVQVSSNESATRHIIRSGETLGLLASRYKTTISKLCEINNLSRNSKLSIGQVIVLPQQANSSSQSQLASTNQPQRQSREGEPVYHQVRSGDTLSKLANKYGVTIEDLCSMNGISRESTLRLGQKIRCS